MGGSEGGCWRGRVAPAEPKNTHFGFEHKVFDVHGAVFKMDRSNGSVALHLTLGGVNASIDMHQLAKTFNISSDTADGNMLKMVEKGLRFVREIRPGDSIPNELLDGSASWAIEPGTMSGRAARSSSSS